ncbi:AAA family ATPase [Salmonella enterica]|nr:AAA family ATPase [Salmonella enterica]EGM2019624.1 AAA family ATPase [Salmonella enterica]
MLIFIAGVHGVGKGHLCSLAEKETGVIHVSASDLIKNNSQLTFDNTKFTATPDKNQRILLAAIKDLKNKETNILLDGHFSLINNIGEVENLKITVFNEMQLDGVILITEPPEIITQRLLSRDGVKISYNLEQLIKSEKENAIHITNELKIPLIILNSPSKDSFYAALKELGMHACTCPN